MRLVMMGTGPFAVPTLGALYETPHAVAALVTQPERRARGQGDMSPNPMRELAQARGTPVFAPENINTAGAQAELARLKPDLFVVADYGQILAASTLAVARLGGINLHGSLLPKYRGAAPVNWAIHQGETASGVTVIQMTGRVDAGPCLARAETAIDPEENAVELEARLAEIGAPLVWRVIDALAAGRAEPLPQDPSSATPARRLRKSDGQIDWSRPAEAIKNQVRALEPWPRTHTFWHRPAGGPLRLIPGRVSVRPGPAGAITSGELPASGWRSDTAGPGTILLAQRSELVVATGEGLLAIHEVQPAGRRLLSTEEFLRGYPLLAGQRFGPGG